MAKLDMVDAIDEYFQYLLVERGLTKATLEDYRSDLKMFFQFFLNHTISSLSH